MFFFLSKTLFYLAMPATWMLILLICALYSEKYRKKVLVLLFCSYLFFSNSFIANNLLFFWEIRPTPIKEVKHYNLAVILTGVTNYGQKPYDRVYFNRGADRILHPLYLYKIGKIDKILITGGDAPADDTVLNESKQLQHVLLTAGVDSNDIFLEPKAINTRENAVLSAPIIKSMVGDKSVLLVTSAFHMRRSLACFQKVGVKCDAFPVDFYITESQYGMTNIFPTAKAFNNWETLAHEIMGYIMYWFMGYI